MPWAAIPFGDYQQRAKLRAIFSASEIPMLVILDEHGDVVNSNACSRVMQDPQGVNFPWPKDGRRNM